MTAQEFAPIPCDGKAGTLVDALQGLLTAIEAEVQPQTTYILKTQQILTGWPDFDLSLPRYRETTSLITKGIVNRRVEIYLPGGRIESVSVEVYRPAEESAKTGPKAKAEVKMDWYCIEYEGVKYHRTEEGKRLMQPEREREILAKAIERVIRRVELDYQTEQLARVVAAQPTQAPAVASGGDGRKMIEAAPEDCVAYLDLNEKALCILYGQRKKETIPLKQSTALFDTLKAAVDCAYSENHSTSAQTIRMSYEICSGVCTSLPAYRKRLERIRRLVAFDGGAGLMHNADENYESISTVEFMDHEAVRQRRAVSFDERYHSPESQP